jgi:UrcA family protein
MKMNKTVATTARALTLCIAATLGFNAVDAFAGDFSRNDPATDAPAKYVVRFPDLNLATIAGVTTLYGRLRQAAYVVCQPILSEQTRFPGEYRTCLDKALSGAVASVHRPLLSQYHELRTKGDNAGLARLAKAN